MSDLEKILEPIIIPYGYGKKLAKRLEMSQNTITMVANGRNKNPKTRLRVINALEEMLKEDLKDI